jgi:hypothetical protein
VFTKLENKIIHKLFDYNLGKLIKEIDSPQNILFSKLKHGEVWDFDKNLTQPSSRQ